jgi:hypothetical protein
LEELANQEAALSSNKKDETKDRKKSPKDKKASAKGKKKGK